MFHQDSRTHWNKLRIWKICYFVVSNSIDMSHRNSACRQYVCDKSQNARGCAKWQWNTLDWCYWTARLVRFTVISHNPVRSGYIIISNYSYCLFACFFTLSFKDVLKYTVILSKFLHFLWKPFFPRSDTRPTQVGDIDPWPVTWPKLSDLIGWGQKISSTSW